MTCLEEGFQNFLELEENDVFENGVHYTARTHTSGLIVLTQFDGGVVNVSSQLDTGKPVVQPPEYPNFPPVRFINVFGPATTIKIRNISAESSVA